MEGDLEEMISALQAADLAERLKDSALTNVMSSRPERSAVEGSRGVTLEIAQRNPSTSLADNKMTVLEVLQSTTAYFKKRGIENPRLNAEHLLAHSLGRKTARSLSRVRARSGRNRTGAVARTRPAARPRRAAATFARHGRVLRATSFFATNARSFRDRKRKNWSSCLNRQSLNRSNRESSIVGTGSGRDRAVAWRKNFPRRKSPPSISRMTRSRWRGKMRPGLASRARSISAKRFAREC